MGSRLLGDLESMLCTYFSLFLSIPPSSLLLFSLSFLLTTPKDLTEGEMKAFPATEGNLRGGIWADGKPKARWSSAGLQQRWPQGRGCNFPDLPVESALDQVHSQAGVLERLESDRSRWPRAPLGLHCWDIALLPPLRAQWTPLIPKRSCLMLFPFFTLESISYSGQPTLRVP